MKFIQIVGLFLITLILALSFSILVDQTLGLLGYPAARPIQITHPENYHKIIHNIEYNVDFTTNSKGLRYKEIPDNKNRNETRTIVLGDSFVEGEGVQYDDTFENLLEYHFNGEHKGTFRFINGGLSNTGPLQYLRLLKFVGLQYKPDYVLICIYANDVADTPEHLSLQDMYRTYTHDYASKPPGLSRLVHWMLPRLYTMYALLRDRMRQGSPPEGFVAKVEFYARKNGISEEKISAWRQSVRQDLVDDADAGTINPTILSYPLLRPDYWTTGLDIATPTAERKFATMVLILDEIARLAREEGMGVGLVFIPAVWQYDPRAYEVRHPMVEGGMVRREWLTERTKIQEKLDAWAKSGSVPFLDLTDFLRQKVAAGKTLNYALDLHWNPAGHAAAAEAIGAWFETDVLSPAPQD